MTASTVEKWREDRQGGAPWLEEVEREILASGIGNPPKTDSSTAVVRGANPKKVNIPPKTTWANFLHPARSKFLREKFLHNSSQLFELRIKN